MQLPADLSVFVGRDAEFARAEAMRPADGELPRRTAVVITGMAGVGKTAFAVRWAHRIASRFPDGQIYVNLRGFDPALRMLTPQEALLALFDSLGVRPEQLPADIDRQSAYLRSLVAGRRLLIVLDNVRDAEQVRPLLPGGDTSFVIVTSRNQLRGLTVQADAGMIRLDGLPPADAVDLLTRRLSDLPMQPDELVEIVERCGRLPLAIAIVAARVAAAPHIPLAAALSGLRDQQGLLDALMDVDDVVDVRSVFSWSLQALSPKAVDLFGLLALHQALYCDERAAASLIGLPVPAVRRLLSELVAANLVDASETGHCSSHDLLRLYAVELAADLPPAQRRASIHRLLDHYVATAQNAEFALNPHHRPPEPIEPQPGTAVKQFSNHDQAWDWFVVEHGPLLMAQNLAADEGFDDHVWRLGWALETFMYRSGHWRQSLTVQQAALAAVSRLGDRALQARVHNSLGRIHLLLDEYDEARRHLTEAISFFEESGLRDQAASGYVSLANLSSDLKNSAEAIRLYKKALELAVDPVLRAGAINNLGNECSIIGDSEQALTLCLQALELWREAGDRHGEAASWDCIAYARHNLGQHAAAAQAYQQAIAAFKELGDNFNQASSLTNLGDCLAAADAPGRAREAWTTALDILTELDHPDGAGVRARLSGLEAS